jgi:hypothetical protein
VFQSHSTKCKRFERDNNCWLYEITITDPDFGTETVMVVVSKNLWAMEASVLAVIKLYSGKGYSVNQIAKNLWLLFELNQRNFWRGSFQKETEYLLQYLPEYQLYHETIQMLRLFS